MKDTLSIIIPAYNEEDSLESAVKTVMGIVPKMFKEYEILVINDGSTDKTRAVADRIVQHYKYVRVLHWKKNRGIGAAFRAGISIATKSYITGFPADDDLSITTFTDILSARRDDAIVSSYMRSMSDRELIRQLISKFFIWLMNVVFRLNLKYYNGYFICPTKMLRSLELKSDGFTIFGEIKVKLMKLEDIKCIEIPFTYKPRLHGVSKALSTKSIGQTISMIITLIHDIYLETPSARKGI